MQGGDGSRNSANLRTKKSRPPPPHCGALLVTLGKEWVAQRYQNEFTGGSVSIFHLGVFWVYVQKYPREYPKGDCFAYRAQGPLIHATHSIVRTKTIVCPEAACLRGRLWHLVSKWDNDHGVVLAESLSRLFLWPTTGEVVKIRRARSHRETLWGRMESVHGRAYPFVHAPHPTGLVDLNALGSRPQCFPC